MSNDLEIKQFEDQFIEKGEDGKMYINFAAISKMIIKDLSKPNIGDRLLRKYDTDTVKQFMMYPERYQRQLRDVSISLYIASPHYKRLILYFANMLTLDYVVAPWGSGILQKPNKKTIQSSYYKVLDYLETFNLKHEFRKILTVAFREDAFYGYQHVVKDTSYIQKFDADHCRITSVEDGTFCFAFDFSFFKGKEEALAMFPEDFKPMYEKYLSDPKLYQWQELDTSKSVCFKLHEDIPYTLPFFVGLFTDIFNINDYKNLVKTKTKLGNYKLLAQKIPIDDKSGEKNNFTITLDVAQKFHANISNNLPQEVGVITTPMDVTPINFNRDLSEVNNVANATNELLDSAGVPKLVFNSNEGGALGLTKSINTDEGIMFTALRQIERIMNKRLRNVGTVRFKVSLLDVTVYNRVDMFGLYLQAGQFGFPVKSHIGACLGMSPSEVMGMSILENDILELHTNMQPLISSHTAGADAMDQGGRPQKKEDQLTDEGAKSRAGQKNKKS